MLGPQKHIQGLTIKEFIFKYLKMFGVLLFIFYYTYPKGLDLFGRSFILPAAAISITLYAWNRFPFKEVPQVIFVFLCFLFWCFFSEYMNNTPESADSLWKTPYLRSQMAWFFTAYLVNFIIFNVHKNPRFEVLVGYIVGAVILQCIITFAMNQDEAANEFFYSLQMQDIYDEETKEATEEMRLFGYGTALFGAGMVAGYALILIVYLISKIKLNTIQFIGLVVSYCFVFFIGLFSARTTVIGLGASIGFLFLLYYLDKGADKKQPIKFIGYSIVMFFIGAGLATQYFSDYTEWAYELFDNFVETGKFSTESSDTLYQLFWLPGTFKAILIGEGSMEFWGNDMGYTRLIFYCGIIGTIFYFAYQFYVASFSMTKDLGANLLVLMIVAYSMVMNIKGLTDLNPVLYLFFFFFIFHKYYRFFPNLYIKRALEIREKEKEEEQNKDNE